MLLKNQFYDITHTRVIIINGGDAMTQFEQEQAAKKFVEFWKEKGNEKSDTQSFWIY